MNNFAIKSVVGRRWLSVALILLTAFATPANAQAVDKPWTTVASAGALDEADTGKVVFSGGTASLSADATLPLTGTAASSGIALGSARAVLRYNVVAVDGLFTNANSYRLTARFRDNGDAAQVVVRLKEFNLNTGATITRITLDSNSSAASPVFQTRSAPACFPNWRFDFVNKAYFIEVELIRTGITGAPGLSSIKLDTTFCVE